jgi:hypothetical protein
MRVARHVNRNAARGSTSARSITGSSEHGRRRAGAGATGSAGRAFSPAIIGSAPNVAHVTGVTCADNIAAAWQWPR